MGNFSPTFDHFAKGVADREFLYDSFATQAANSASFGGQLISVKQAVDWLLREFGVPVDKENIFDAWDFARLATYQFVYNQQQVWSNEGRELTVNDLIGFIRRLSTEQSLQERLTESVVDLILDRAVTQMGAKATDRTSVYQALSARALRELNMTDGVSMPTLEKFRQTIDLILQSAAVKRAVWADARAQTQQIPGPQPTPTPTPQPIEIVGPTGRVPGLTQLAPALPSRAQLVEKKQETIPDLVVPILGTITISDPQKADSVQESPEFSTVASPLNAAYRTDFPALASIAAQLNNMGAFNLMTFPGSNERGQIYDVKSKLLVDEYNNMVAGMTYLGSARTQYNYAIQRQETAREQARNGSPLVAQAVQNDAQVWLNKAHDSLANARSLLRIDQRSDKTGSPLASVLKETTANLAKAETAAQNGMFSIVDNLAMGVTIGIGAAFGGPVGAVAAAAAYNSVTYVLPRNFGDTAAKQKLDQIQGGVVERIVVTVINLGSAGLALKAPITSFLLSPVIDGAGQVAQTSIMRLEGVRGGSTAPLTQQEMAQEFAQGAIVSILMNGSLKFFEVVGAGSSRSFRPLSEVEGRQLLSRSDVRAELGAAETNLGTSRGSGAESFATTSPDNLTVISTGRDAQNRSTISTTWAAKTGGRTTLNANVNPSRQPVKLPQEVRVTGTPSDGSAPVSPKPSGPTSQIGFTPDFIAARNQLDQLDGAFEALAGAKAKNWGDFDGSNQQIGGLIIQQNRTNPATQRLEVGWISIVDKNGGVYVLKIDNKYLTVGEVDRFEIPTIDQIISAAKAIGIEKADIKQIHVGHSHPVEPGRKPDGTPSASSEQAALSSGDILALSGLNSRVKAAGINAEVSISSIDFDRGVTTTAVLSATDVKFSVASNSGTMPSHISIDGRLIPVETIPLVGKKPTIIEKMFPKDGPDSIPTSTIKEAKERILTDQKNAIKLESMDDSIIDAVLAKYREKKSTYDGNWLPYDPAKYNGLTRSEIDTLDRWIGSDDSVSAALKRDLMANSTVGRGIVPKTPYQEIVNIEANTGSTAGPSAIQAGASASVSFKANTKAVGEAIIDRLPVLSDAQKTQLKGWYEKGAKAIKLPEELGFDLGGNVKLQVQNVGLPPYVKSWHTITLSDGTKVHLVELDNGLIGLTAVPPGGKLEPGALWTVGNPDGTYRVELPASSGTSGGVMTVRIPQTLYPSLLSNGDSEVGRALQAIENQAGRIEVGGGRGTGQLNPYIRTGLDTSVNVNESKLFPTQEGIYLGLSPTQLDAMKSAGLIADKPGGGYQLVTHAGPSGTLKIGPAAGSDFSIPFQMVDASRIDSSSGLTDVLKDVMGSAWPDIPNVVQGTFKAGVSYKGTLTSNTALTPRQVELFNGALGSANANGNSTNPIWIGQQINPAQNRTGTDSLLTLLDDRIPDSAVIELLSGDRGADILSAQMRTQFDTIAKKLKDVGVEVSIKANGELRWIWDNPTSRRTSVPNPAELSLLRAIGVDTNLAWPNGTYRPVMTRSGIPIAAPRDPGQPGQYVQSRVVFGGGSAQPSYQSFAGASVAPGQLSSRSLVQFTVDGGTVDIYVAPVVADALALYPATGKGPLEATYTSLNSNKSGKIALQDYLAERVGAASSTDRRSALSILAERINSSDSRAGLDPSVLNPQGHTYLQAFLLLDAGVIDLSAATVNAQLLPRIGSLAATTRDLPWANPDGSRTFSKPESMSQEDFDQVVGATRNVKNFIDWLKKLGKPVSDGTIPKQTSSSFINPDGTLIASVSGGGATTGTQTVATPDGKLSDQELRERFPNIFPTTAIEPGSVAGTFREAYNAARTAAYGQEFLRINRERLGSLPSEQVSALAEIAIDTPEWEAKFSTAGMAAVNATPAAQNAYLNGYIQTMNNGRLARGEEGFTPAQIAVARTTFAAARAAGKSESEAAAAAIAAAVAAPSGAAEPQPALREPPPIINLATLTSWTASAKAVAIATGNPTGVIMANAIETTLGALTTLAQTNAQLKDGVAGNAIATLARGSAKTFAAVVELIGKGDIKSFVAVVNDIAETVAQFATGDERAGFANGLKSIGSLAQVLGTKDRNPASLFTATVFNEISAVVAVGGTRRDRLDAGGEKIPVRNANGTQRTETKNGVPVLVWETEPVPGLIEGRAIQAGGRVLKKFGELSGDKTIQGAAEGLVAYGQFVELSRNGTPGDGAGALVMGLGRGVNLVIGGKTGRLAEDLSAVAQFGLAEEGKTAVLYQIDTTIPVVATTSKIRGADGVEREVTTYTYNTVAVPDPERPTQKKRYIIESGVQAKTVQMAGKAVQVVGKYIDSKLVQALGIAGEHYGQFIRLNANNKPGDGQAVLAVGFGQALNLVIGGETGAAIAELGTITSGVFTGANLTRNVVDSNGQIQYIYEAVIGPNGPDRRPLLGQDGKPLIQQEVVPGREGVYVSAGGKVINLAGRIFDSRELQGVGILVDGAGQYIQMSKDGIANNGTAALVASVGQAFQLLAPGAFGQAIQKLTDIASDVMKIAANTIPGGAGALYAQLAVKALDLIGIKILSTPESQFAFQAVMTLLTANNPIGWALLVLPKLFGMRTFHKENILAAGIDADGDAKFDDSAVLRQQFRQGFFRLNYQNHQIMYDVNGVDVRLLQNANVRMSPQVDKAPLTMRGGYYEEGWASTFFTMPDGTQVIGRVIMGSGGTPLYVMGTGGGNIGGDDPAKAKAAAYFAANPTMNQFGSQYAFVADDGRVFGVASDENADILGVEVPNGSFWLDLSATYGAINPATSGLAVAKRLGLSASDANIWRQAMGGDNVSVSQGDTRLQAGSYLSNALNDISARYQGQRNDPNLYQYMDMNGDGNPDLVRVGLTDKNLKVKGDGLIEVWMLDKDRKQTGVTFKTTSFSKAEEIGMLSGQLLQWGAGRPELWDSGRDPAALHAMADATGVLAYMKEAEVLGIQATASLLGGVQVDYEAISTRLEQLQTAIASKFDANAYMALHPDVLAWAGGDPNKASLHYLNYGNSERRAIKSSGETLQVWQARADSWDSLAILKYVASYPDLMNAFGADSTAAKAHWNAYGRWEGRTTSFNIDAYLAAHPYLREQALVSLATSTPQVLTDEEGRPIRGYDENSGEYFTRYRRDYDGDVAMTTTTPTEEDIKLFATKHWITTGRSENANPYAVSLAAMSPVVQVLGDSIVTSAIGPNQSLVSADGRFSATMQGDGNFVVYDRLARKVMWTAATSAGGYMVMQGDGNVVLYRPGGARFDWASNTSSPGVMRGFTLSMQNDGNLAAYDSQGGEPLWSTVTGRIASPEPNGEGPTMAAYQARKAAKDAADRDEMFASMRAAGNNPTAQASGMTPFQRLFNSLAK